MNKKYRVKMVKAMEYIARHINDENVFEGRLMEGVADGDIYYGDLTYEPSSAQGATSADCADYIEDRDFGHIPLVYAEGLQVRWPVLRRGR